MSDINVEYTYFYVVNHTGTASLTGYALPNAPFTFLPNIGSEFSQTKVLWDFGDHSNSTELSATHYYSLPGTYRVTLFTYDSEGKGYTSSFSSDVVVRDFISDSCTFSLSNTLTFPLTSGVFSPPIGIVRTNSHRVPPSGHTISFGSSGGANNFFDQGLDTNKYGHLLPYSSFYKIEDGEYVEIEEINTRSNTSLYCVLTNGAVQLCLSSYDSSIYCGSSGVDTVYFKGDIPVNQANLYTWFDLQQLNDTLSYSHLNTSVHGISCNIIENTDWSEFSVTSTGIDGEGAVLSVFNIDQNQFVNSSIYFVCKIKDSNWYSVKYPSIFTLTPSFSCIVVDGNGNTVRSTFVNNFTITNELSTGGYFKGYFIPHLSATNCVLSCFGTVNSIPLQGTSSTFNIYPSVGTYSIQKKNENFDWGQTMKDISFQDVLLQSDSLHNYFSTVFGTLTSAPTSPGKLAYERIANFVDNNSIIDRSTIEAFYSLCSQYNFDPRGYDGNMGYPAEIKRLVDLFSLNYGRLVGSTNKFDNNFNIRGFHDTDVNGTNIGDEINFRTYQLSSQDGFIVGQEKFSGEYIKLSTNIALSSGTFPLTSYNSDWGWNLVLGSNTAPEDITNYYTFYEYVSGYEGTRLDSVIDPDSSVYSYQDWIRDGGIIDNMLIYQFLSNTNIISSE